MFKVKFCQYVFLMCVCVCVCVCVRVCVRVRVLCLCVWRGERERGRGGGRPMKLFLLENRDRHFIGIVRVGTWSVVTCNFFNLKTETDISLKSSLIMVLQQLLNSKFKVEFIIT